MDSILRQMEARQAARGALVEEEPPSAAMVAAMEQARLAKEAHLREMNFYKEKVKGHMHKLMKSEHKWTQYPPMDMERMHIIARVAEEFSLVSHEFGEEGIDRFIIVYKPEYQPDDDEIARLNLKHTQKLDDATVAKILAGNTHEPSELGEKKPKKQRQTDQEAEERIDPEMLHAVGTVKRVRRSASEAIEDVRMKSYSKPKSIADDVDNLFNPN
jgi:hypothetical protein